MTSVSGGAIIKKINAMDMPYNIQAYQSQLQ